MDIIDFVEALKRQKWFLILGGLVLILAVVSVNYRVEDLSFEPRVEPKYTATVQMAVVPEGVTTLSDPGVTGNFEGAANFYAQLIRSPQASSEISEDQNVVFTDPISVSVLDRTGVMTVTMTASTPDGAERAALGSFRWLEQKLAEEPLIAAIPQPEPEEAEGPQVTSVVLDVDPLYAGLSEDLFVAVSTSSGDGFTIPLGEAPLSARPFQIVMPPDPQLTVAIEMGDGTEVGSADFDLPVVTEDGGSLPPIIVSVEQGAVVLSDELSLDGDLEVVENRIDATWDLSGAAEDDPDAALGQLSVMLLNEIPIVGEVGLRRVPVLVGAPIIAGILVLLATATVIDRYRQLKREHALAEAQASGLHVREGGRRLERWDDDGETRQAR